MIFRPPCPCSSALRSAIWSRSVRLLLVAVLLMTSGCVRRRMTVRSDPPGAVVWVDKQEIGVTPVSHSFVYYGTRDFLLTRDGYETAVGKRTFKAPWYQWPVIDFFTENLWPFELRDERVVEFQMIPQKQVGTEKLIDRAKGLRASGQSGLVMPLPPQENQPAGPSLLPAAAGQFAPPPPEVITPP